MSKTYLSHIEINVSDYIKSIKFYDLILESIGWERYVCTAEFTAYCDGYVKLILSPVEKEFKDLGFHRKKVGLNHIAFYALKKSDVDTFYQRVLVPNKIPSLYHSGPVGDDEYYSVFFEDPDRIKIELVYSPHYCEKDYWPNNIKSDFDPYKEL